MFKRNSKTRLEDWPWCSVSCPSVAQWGMFCLISFCCTMRHVLSHVLLHNETCSVSCPSVAQWDIFCLMSFCFTMRHVLSHVFLLHNETGLTGKWRKNDVKRLYFRHNKGAERFVVELSVKQSSKKRLARWATVTFAALWQGEAQDTCLDFNSRHQIYSF
jgi:hypothetical protein